MQSLRFVVVILLRMGTRTACPKRDASPTNQTQEDWNLLYLLAEKQNAVPYSKCRRPERLPHSNSLLKSCWPFVAHTWWPTLIKRMRGQYAVTMSGRQPQEIVGMPEVIRPSHTSSRKRCWLPPAQVLLQLAHSVQSDSWQSMQKLVQPNARV